MASTVRLSAALCCACCELFCPRLSTGRFRKTKRFPEWCGLLNESLSKLLYICCLGHMNWPRGGPMSVLYTERREEGTLVCSLPFHFKDMCLTYTPPTLYSGHNSQQHPSNVRVHLLQITDSILMLKHHQEEGKRRYIRLDRKLPDIYPASRTWRCLQRAILYIHGIVACLVVIYSRKCLALL